MKKRLTKSFLVIVLIITLFLSVLFSGAEKNKIMNMPFFGTWRIDEVAVVSWTYEDMIASVRKPVEPADYIGYELEYGQTLFRLGEAEYQDIYYEVDYKTVSARSSGGNFRKPDLFGYIVENEIELNGMKDWSGDTLLLGFDVKFIHDVSYEQYSYIPVGTHCFLLNEDTMIVGVWGKTLLAHKVNNRQFQII